jgi:hypothetical protein
MHYLLALMQELLAADKEKGAESLAKYQVRHDAFQCYAALAVQMGNQVGDGDGGHNGTEIEKECNTPLPSIDGRLHLLDSRLLVPELQLMF